MPSFQFMTRGAYRLTRRYRQRLHPHPFCFSLTRWYGVSDLGRSAKDETLDYDLTQRYWSARDVAALGSLRCRFAKLRKNGS